MNKFNAEFAFVYSFSHPDCRGLPLAIQDLIIEKLPARSKHLGEITVSCINQTAAQTTTSLQDRTVKIIVKKTIELPTGAIIDSVRTKEAEITSAKLEKIFARLVSEEKKILRAEGIILTSETNVKDFTANPIDIINSSTSEIQRSLATIEAIHLQTDTKQLSRRLLWGAVVLNFLETHKHENIKEWKDIFILHFTLKQLQSATSLGFPNQAEVLRQYELNLAERFKTLHTNTSQLTTNKCNELKNLLALDPSSYPVFTGSYAELKTISRFVRATFPIDAKDAIVNLQLWSKTRFHDYDEFLDKLPETEALFKARKFKLVPKILLMIGGSIAFPSPETVAAGLIEQYTKDSRKLKELQKGLMQVKWMQMFVHSYNFVFINLLKILCNSNELNLNVYTAIGQKIHKIAAEHRLTQQTGFVISPEGKNDRKFQKLGKVIEDLIMNFSTPNKDPFCKHFVIDNIDLRGNDTSLMHQIVLHDPLGLTFRFHKMIDNFDSITDQLVKFSNEMKLAVLRELRSWPKKIVEKYHGDISGWIRAAYFAYVDETLNILDIISGCSQLLNKTESLKLYDAQGELCHPKLLYFLSMANIDEDIDLLVNPAKATVDEQPAVSEPAPASASASVVVVVEAEEPKAAAAPALQQSQSQHAQSAAAAPAATTVITEAKEPKKVATSVKEPKHTESAIAQTTASGTAKKKKSKSASKKKIVTEVAHTALKTQNEQVKASRAVAPVQMKLPKPKSIAALLKALKELGCAFVRQGKEHAIFKTVAGNQVSVPRHEAGKGTLLSIIKQAETDFTATAVKM